MIVRNTLAAAVTAVALLTTAGCAVTRDQSTVGEYVDDTTISTKVKAKFIEDKAVAASSIQVVPVISPLPFIENQPAITGSSAPLARGSTPRTPLRTPPPRAHVTDNDIRVRADQHYARSSPS